MSLVWAIFFVIPFYLTVLAFCIFVIIPAMGLQAIAIGIGLILGGNWFMDKWEGRRTGRPRSAP